MYTASLAPLLDFPIRPRYASVTGTCVSPCESCVWTCQGDKTKHAPPPRVLMLSDFHLSHSQVSFAQFLLNICFIFSCQSAVTSHETISEETMSEIFKAEMVFIKDSSATEGRGEGGNVLPSDKQLKVSTTRFCLTYCMVLSFITHISL